MRPPIVVCGAGAAGLVAALFIARGGRPVCLLERTSDGGRKILISGGGRCNILPSALDERRFVTDSSPNTLRKILRSWPLAAQRAFFERDLGLALELEADTGKLFPASHRARDVRDALVAAVRAAGADLRFGTTVRQLRPQADGGWRVDIEGGGRIDAAAVILATGGLSVPTTGSDGAGLRIAAELGHAMRPTYPALTPLTQTPPRYAHLSGISLTVALTAGTGKRALATSGGFLITHRGFSGPTVLDISHVAVRALMESRTEPIRVCWGNRDADAWEARLRPGPGTVGTAVRELLPQRLVDTLLAEAKVAADLRLAELSRSARRCLIDVLTAWPLPYDGHEGYRKAEVTGGGVDLGAVDPRRLESRRHPGLFLCGELLDAFGPIGGYNFAWAWATGRAAGLGALAVP